MTPTEGSSSSSTDPVVISLVHELPSDEHYVNSHEPTSTSERALEELAEAAPDDAVADINDKDSVMDGDDDDDLMEELDEHTDVPVLSAAQRELIESSLSGHRYFLLWRHIEPFDEIVPRFKRCLLIFLVLCGVPHGCADITTSGD